MDAITDITVEKVVVRGFIQKTFGDEVLAVFDNWKKSQLKKEHDRTTLEVRPFLSISRKQNRIRICINPT